MGPAHQKVDMVGRLILTALPHPRYPLKLKGNQSIEVLFVLVANPKKPFLKDGWLALCLG